MANTRFELVTPTATMYSGEAEMVVCKSVDGEIAFLADHMAYIGALDPCLVRVVSPEPGGEEVRVAVRSGFVEVKGNRVIMLADVALRPEEVDVDAAERDASAAGSEAELKWAQARLEAARPG